MNASLVYESFCRLCWQPEYLNAWRLSFEGSDRRALLLDVLRALPPELGRLEFVKRPDAERFIVIFTHDHENSVAREHESQIISTVIEIGALKFFGAEGTSEEEIDASNLRQGTDRLDLERVARYLFNKRKLGPIGYAKIVVESEISVVGLENQELYDRAARGLIAGKNSDYFKAISERRPMLFYALVERMQKKDEVLAGMTLTDYNYDGHPYLDALNVGCAGVRSHSGRSEVHDLASLIKSDREPNEVFLQVWQRIDEENRDYNGTGFKRWMRRLFGRRTIEPLPEPLAGRLAGHAKRFAEEPRQRAFGVYFLCLMLIEMDKCRHVGTRVVNGIRCDLFEHRGDVSAVPRPRLSIGEWARLKEEAKVMADEVRQM